MRYGLGAFMLSLVESKIKIFTLKNPNQLQMNAGSETKKTQTGKIKIFKNGEGAKYSMAVKKEQKGEKLS